MKTENTKDKNVIFFSHSHEDKLYVNKLRDILLKKTSKTIEIFCSSDGQSIPFGKNWIHKVEEALQDAKIMFVFLSPNSIHSNWIYFESGFSYSKNIRVIPIGILGVDLNKILPPLSLLNGFNVNSSQGYNNIITIINECFNYSFDEDFTEKEFIELNFGNNKYSINIDYLNYISRIEFGLPFKLVDELNTNSLKLETFDQIEKEVKDSGITYGVHYNEIYAQGISIINDVQNKEINITINPMKYDAYVNLIKKIINISYTETVKKFWFYIIPSNDTYIEHDELKVSSNLFDSGVNYSKKGNKLFEYNDCLIAVDSNFHTDHLFRTVVNGKKIRVIFDIQKIEDIDVLSLVELFVKSQLLLKKKHKEN